jgi:regulator of protease activity HflC (stomatin/prohibitin superfamily)
MRDVPEESLMLTGDENIVDVDFTVLWRIKPDGVGDYLFNIQNPEGTVKAVAESAMREVIGRSNIQPILTGARTRDRRAGSDAEDARQLRRRRPGHAGADAEGRSAGAGDRRFRDVQAARADLERAQNEAQTYANRVVPDARGRAAQILQVAEAYKRADGRRGQGPERALPEGLRRIQEGARRHAPAHLSGDDGAHVSAAPTRSSSMTAAAVLPAERRALSAAQRTDAAASAHRPTTGRRRAGGTR